MFGPTRSHAERAIPIPPSLLEELENDLESIDADPDTLPFTGEKGGPLPYRYAYMDIWRPVLANLKMPVVGMHALRHSAPARMISAGASAKTVQSIMGHRSPALTLTVYGDLFDEADHLATRLDMSRHRLWERGSVREVPSKMDKRPGGVTDARETSTDLRHASEFRGFEASAQSQLAPTPY